MLYLSQSQKNKICQIVGLNSFNPFIKINMIQAIQIAENTIGEFYGDIIDHLFKSHGYTGKSDDTKPFIPLLKFISFLNRNYKIRSRL